MTKSQRARMCAAVVQVMREPGFTAGYHHAAKGLLRGIDPAELRAYLGGEEGVRQLLREVAVAVRIVRADPEWMAIIVPDT